MQLHAQGILAAAPQAHHPEEPNESIARNVIVFEQQDPAMPKVTFIAFNGTQHAVDVPVGTTLMRAAVDHNVPGIDGDCGGQCACATCHVFVDPAWTAATGERTQVEDDMLNFAAELRENSRLACQIELTDALDGLVVAMPEGQH